MCNWLIENFFSCQQNKFVRICFGVVFPVLGTRPSPKVPSALKPNISGFLRWLTAIETHTMTDPRYRLAKQEELHLDVNANNAEVRFMRGKQTQVCCNTSVLVFLIILLALTCIALVAFLAIEKTRNSAATSPSLVHLNTSADVKRRRLPCTSAQCVLAASSK